MKTVRSKLEKDKDCLKKTSNKYDLPILTLAILKNRITLVPKLIEAGASLEQKDICGWFPIHHAALASEELFQLIVGKTKGNILTKMTPLNGTCEHLRIYAGLVENPTSTKNLQIELESGKPIPFKPEEHLALFGMTKYIDGAFYPPEMLKNLWMQQKSQNPYETINNIYCRLLEKAFENPPKLVIKSSSIGKDVSKNWGLFTNQDLPMGSGVATYGGQFFDQSRTGDMLAILNGKVFHSEYLLVEVDAEKVGNCARFANDGFPNCCINPAGKVRGLSNIGVLTIIKEGGVKKGEELFWDYGQGEAALKWNSKSYRVPNPEEMREFIRKFTMQLVEEKITISNKCLSLNNGKDEQSQLLYLIAGGYLTRMQYCFYTPAAILDLWCHEIITAKNWYEQLHNSELLKIIRPAEHNPQTALVNRFLGFLKFLENELSSSEEGVNKKVRIFLLNLIGKYTMLEVSEVILYIISWLKKNNGQNWESFSKELIENIPHCEDRDISKLKILSD